MRPCHHVEIITPKQVVLNGLWFGPKRPKRVVVWVHGLGSNMFSRIALISTIADSETAVLAFNNRGYERISRIRYATKKKTGIGGSAHEIFTESFDDIQGVVSFLKRTGVRKIFLAGHSTGAQKVAYWASKTKRLDTIQGLILLGALSDYSVALDVYGARALAKATRVACDYVRRGKKGELLPSSIWPEILDAQRFLSLYSGESAEEIFSYSFPSKRPKILQAIRRPILVLLAEKDEYADRPAKNIGDWFAEHLKIGDEIIVVPRVRHSFRGAEKSVAKIIRAFMAEHGK